MTSPKLLFAGPQGQSAVRAIFDQPMRELGVSSPADPENPANWATGGGLPAVVSVVRTSNVEFELVLASPAPVAGGYSITVSSTVESADSAEPMDPAFLTPALFAVAASDADLVVSSIVWTTDTVLDITLSEPIAPIIFDAYADVVQFLAQNRGSREPQVIGFSQSGAVITITLGAAGTAGADYRVSLNREVFVSAANNTTLLLGAQEQQVYGQGAAPTIAALALTEDSVEVTSSEVLGEPLTSGWNLSHGLYAISAGSLDPSTALTAGATPAVLTAPGASLLGESGNTISFSVLATSRLVVAGNSFTDQATSAVGAGSEAVGAGTTTISKTVGAPYELLFSGGSDSLTRAGRRFDTTVRLTSFTPGPTTFSLMVFTLLNTQTSVVIRKTINDMAVIRIFRGNKDLGVESAEFDPSVAFVLSVIDATSDSAGFLAVEVNGRVVLGAQAKDILDDKLIQTNTGATQMAVTFGDPAATSEVFDVDFSADISIKTYLATGFLGLDSNDLFSFAGSSATAVVGAANSPPLSSGYSGTGKAAFGVHAEFLPEVNAIQVVIGLNADAKPAQYSGTTTLLTGQEQVLDQVVFDQTYELLGEGELFFVFLNPLTWDGTLVGVSLTISGVDYSVTVPVTVLGQPNVLGSLAPQPSKWYHQRLSNSVGEAGAADFGPAVIISTP